MKKFIPVLVLLIVLAGGVLFVLPGFEKRTDVCLQDFSVSEDGSVMTIKTALLGSMGFIRDIETERVGNEIHCSFYRAFGGLNSGIGSKNMFEIELDDFAEKICFDRGTGADIIVLERDTTAGAWTWKRPGLSARK